MIERWHGSLKAAVMCHESHNWVAVLPTVLLGLRCSFKENLGASAAEMVYGVPLRLPGEFFVDMDRCHDFVLDRFRDAMRRIRPKPTVHHCRKSHFVSDLHTCTHVFVRVDAVRKPFEQPYEGSHRVVERISDSAYLIRYRGCEQVISTERLKPAFIETADEIVQPRRTRVC
uniref:uncharacterized protein LOC117605348 n=1 Tax=Osmia lignaria TaxID=473952 RepID=UPI00147876AB|nr:uncharacterized protein LOC117605348 [Osmia lignaria]